MTYNDNGGSSQGPGGANPTANDTAKGTDTGTDATGVTDSGAIDGGTDTVVETNSDTYNDTDTITTTTTDGATTMTENLDNAGTTQSYNQVAVQGVADSSVGSSSGYGSGSSSSSGPSGPTPQGTTDAVIMTTTGTGSYNDSTVKTPDPNGGTDETDVVVSSESQANSNSGTTPWGPFSSYSSATSGETVTITTTPRGTTAGGSGSTTPGPVGSTGTFPSGQIAADAETVVENAANAPNNAEQATSTQVAFQSATTAATPNAPGAGAPAPAPPSTPAPAAPAVAPPPFTPPLPGTNQSKNFVNDMVFWAVRNTYYKTIVLGNQKTLPNNGKPLPNSLHIGVDSGQYVIVPKLPPGYDLGSTGASTCIGVIIADPTGRVCCYHFNSGNSPGGNMNMANPGMYPKGTKVLIFGGNNTEESNFVLAQVVANLEANGVGYIYSDTTGGNVDSNGNFFLYANDKIKP